MLGGNRLDLRNGSRPFPSAFSASDGTADKSLYAGRNSRFFFAENNGNTHGRRAE
jgi:hypothetical protein